MNFSPPPAKKQTNAPPRGVIPPGPQRRQQAPETDVWECPQPQQSATVASLIGLVITAFAASRGGAAQRSSAMASIATIGTILSLALGFSFDVRKGLNNLIRADVLALLAFNFLTLFEFLFP